MPDILELLIAERDKLNRAIEALSGARRRGRPPADGYGRDRNRPAAGRRRGGMSAEARRAQSQRMKLFWAERRKQKAKARA